MIADSAKVSWTVCTIIQTKCVTNFYQMDNVSSQEHVTQDILETANMGQEYQRLSEGKVMQLFS